MSEYTCNGCTEVIHVCKRYMSRLNRRNPERICRKCRLRGKVEEYDQLHQVTSDGRKCITCSEWKQWDQYTINGGQSRRLNMSQCKDCTNSQFKTKWDSDPEYKRKTQHHTKNSYLKRTYGIDLVQYERLKNSQNSKCKICKLETKLYVDHCHTTGTVRGLLCRDCNTGIGLLKENLETLQSAMEYLKCTSK